MAKCENENKASLVVSYIYLVYMLMDWRENPGWGASRSSCSDLDGLDLICYSMKAKADGASDWLALELGEKPLARTWPRVQSLVLKANSAESLNRVWLFATPWTAACQASLYIIYSQSLLKLMSIESLMPSNHLILFHPLLLPSVFLSIRVFSNESVLCIRWPNYWSFSASASVLPMNIQDLTSFRTDWLDLLAVQGTLKTLLQHHSSKALLLWHSAFFIVQLTYPYMTTGKTIALTRWTFVGKVMSLLLKLLSRLVITFLPRSKHLLISWLQSPCAVLLEPKK